MTTSTAPTVDRASTDLIPRLRQRLRGEVITASDEQYERARMVFHGGVDDHPVAIARPVDAREVAAAVRLAAETGVELRSAAADTAARGTARMTAALCSTWPP